MNYFYSKARHSRSGTTMQKLPASPGQLERAERRRMVHAGFPWAGQFSSAQEIEAYLSGDEIACLLCGKPYLSLAPHIGRIHDTGADAYRQRFGIPRDTTLSGRSTREVLAERIKKGSASARAKMEKVRAGRDVARGK